MHDTPLDGTLERWTTTQKLIAVFAALAFFADGMGTQAMGLALPAVIKAWAVPRAALAGATAWGLVGFAAGAFLGGLCGDRFGRQATLVGSLLLMGVASGAISAFAVGGLGGGLVAGWLSQRYGSRPALWILCLGGAATGVLLALMTRTPGGDGTQLILAVGMLGATIIGLQTALYALGAHVYEAQLRSSGIGVAVGWGRIGAIGSAFTGVVSLDLGGTVGYFSFLSVAALLALACALLVNRQIAGRQRE